MHNQGVIVEAVLKPSEFKLFKEMIYNHAGISLTDTKHSLVQNRLRKRLRFLNLSRFRDYFEYISEKNNEDEFQECINALTTNETYFFRHKHHWDYLVSTLIPNWKKNNSYGSTFRAWSAASSTGEEPYSLTILLDDCLSGNEGWHINVHATDINKEVLTHAKEGVYGEYALQKVTRLCLEKYFNDIGEKHYQVTDSIRKMVEFSIHNLQVPSAGNKYDVVFLRNVMIYFDDISKSRVIANITSRLKNGGYLFLGGAESLSACREQYDQIHPTIYRKRYS